MRIVSLGSGLLVLAACSGSTSSGSPTGSATGAFVACSPLEANMKPIALGNILGAGRAADGTVYVLDDGDPAYRAFVSQGNVLQRKEVAGSGSTGEGTITATVADATPWTLQVESANGSATKMGLYRGALPTKTFEIGKDGDVLTIVGTDVVRAFELRNLPGDVVAEYDARTADGHRLFVTRPKTDGHDEDFRVFYGTPERMEERELVSATRGSTTYLVFAVDGVEHTAVFPSQLSAPSVTPRLSSAGSSQALTVLAPVSPGADLTFYCR
jgi:hypothetical protein